MIELSGYAGRSIATIRSRMVNSNELRTNRDVVSKKYKIGYNTQTLIMGKGFKMIPDGTLSKKSSIAEVNNIDDFEKFVVDLTMGKHINAKKSKNNGVYTIFSDFDSEHVYVDIIEIASISGT